MMGQRTKELVLLVLALAFLAVALYTIRGKREPVVPPPAPAPEEQAEATPGETAEPGTEQGESAGEQAGTEAEGAVRNPFALPGTTAAAPVEPAAAGESPEEQVEAAGEPTAAVASLPEGEVRLAGIVAGLAVIRVGERRHYVRAGDRVGDYQVQSVGQHEVVLSSAAGQITLRMGGRQ
jgi:hypothetical protein